MAKDPAFLFYPSDFTTGTQFFSDEQVGVFVRLLCAQHQHGHLTDPQVRSICRGIANTDAMAEIRAKFSIDSDGKLFNERLENEIIKRKKHSEKQSENARMRWHKSGIEMAEPLAMPLENRNRNRNKNKIETGIEIKKTKPPKPVFVPPTQQEVELFVQGEGFPYELAVKVFKYYNDADWHDAQGSKVKNWKQKIRGVWLKDENKKNNGQQQQRNPNGGKFTDEELMAAVLRNHGHTSNG